MSKQTRVGLGLLLAIGFLADGCGTGCGSSIGGGGGVDGGGIGGTGGSGPTPAPVISFSANPNQVPEGVASTLSWVATNATSCEASGAWTGSRAVSGSASTGPLSVDSTYRLSCTGPGGSDSQTVTVTVSGSPAPPTVTLTASPSSVPQDSSAMLSWTSTDTASCTASGGWTGDRPPSGTESTGSLSETSTFTLECTGPGGSASDSTVVETTAIEPSTVFPLSVAPDRRHVLDASDRPFLINGDTPWSLMVALDDSEVTQYLDDRQSRGFNTILTNLIEHYFAADPPRNVYDVAPFTTAEDIRTPNDAYFDRCVGIVQQALDRHLLVMMTPAYLGYGGGDEGWWQAVSARSASEVQAYGAYLGAKFASFPNIVWVMGGDYWDPQVITATRSLVTGLKSTGRSDWLFTYHTGPNTSSSDVVGGEAWLDLNAIYNYGDLVGAFEQGFGQSPLRPFLLFETRYEQEPDPPISRLALRSQAYWSIVTGGNGALLGNNPIWNFENRALYPYVGTWQSNLGSPGSQDRTRFESFFSTYDWSTLVPDRDNTVLTGGHGSGTDAAYAAKSNDSTLVIVYAPSPRDLTIDMTVLAGPDVLARWFKPDTGSYSAIGTYPNTGSRSFSPPGSGDWVLVLQTPS